MSALNFPTSGLYPGYQYTGDNGITYIYDGVKWIGHAPTLAPGTSSLVNGTNVVQLTGDGTLVLPIPSNANPGTGAIGFLGTWIKNTDQGGIYLSPQDANVWIQLPSSTDSPTTPLELTNRGLGGVTVDSGIGNTVIKNYNSATNLDNVWTFDSNGEFTLPTGGRLGFAGKGWTGLDGGNGQPVSLTSLYPSGMYSGCVTIAPGGGINISTYGDGTGQTGGWTFGNDGIFYGPIEGGLQVSGYIEASKGNGINLVAGQPSDIFTSVTAIGDSGTTSTILVNTSVNNDAYLIPVGATFSVDSNPANDLAVIDSSSFAPGEWALTVNGTFNLVAGNNYTVKYPSTNYNNVAVTTHGGSWSFGADGRTTFPSNNAQTFQIVPAVTTYLTTSTPAVVFASSSYSIETMKATIQVLDVTGIYAGGVSTYHSQICEMLIVRKRIYDANIDATSNSVEAMVYGVVHTSATPMATFDAQWNATTSNIEITATVDPAYAGVNVKVMATESVNLAP